MTHEPLYSFFNQSEVLQGVYPKEFPYCYWRPLDLLSTYKIVVRNLYCQENLFFDFSRKYCSWNISGKINRVYKLFLGKVFFGMLFLTREKFGACTDFGGYNFSLFEHLFSFFNRTSQVSDFTLNNFVNTNCVRSEVYLEACKTLKMEFFAKYLSKIWKRVLNTPLQVLPKIPKRDIR